jgi:1,2-dihydroxy-3-keto-5-methylthiopentene dioxygenase
MATIHVRDDGRVLGDDMEVGEYLAVHGIWHRRFDTGDLPEDASDQQILDHFREPIRQQMESGGYRSVDLIDVSPDTPGLEAMLDKFNQEHWHDEDEVRFIVSGRGLFHVHPQEGSVFSIEVEAGDMINVPRGTHHWFDLCEDRRIRAVRLFQSIEGWAPHYTASGEETKHQPLCFGPSYLPLDGL